jgi:uncharacterized protein (DUF2147 family)
MKNRPTPRAERAFIDAIRCSLLAIGLAVVMPIAATAQDATGLWRTEATQEGYLEVQIAPCGAELCGTILRARDLQGHEQPYPHVGRWMIRNMVPTGPNNWGNGQIWDPRNDRTFRSRMELSGNNLAVSGCVLGFCESQSWSRVN